MVIIDQNVAMNKDGDASNVFLRDSNLVITDATIKVSDVAMADVCVKGNDCNADDVIAAGKDAGLVVDRVGSKVAYDMVSSFVSSECNSFHMDACWHA